MNDGRIVSPKKQEYGGGYDGHYGVAIGGGRGSEDRQRIIQPPAGALGGTRIVRTDEVDVFRSGDDDSIPSMRNKVYAG